MSKHLKLRFYRAIIGSLQSCRSTDPSDLPENPLPLLPKSLHARRRRRVFSASVPTPAADLPLDKQAPDAEAVIHEPVKPRRKVCSSSEDDAPHAPPPTAAVKIRKRRVKKIVKTNKNPHSRASTSSAESVWFSSECAGAAAAGGGGGEEETETLVSSSTDSSAKSRRRSRRRRALLNLKRGQRGGVLRSPAAGVEIPARLSVFKKLIPCSVEGKVKESFAVVKRSEEPLEDFKSSMLDMIVEKQMFDREDLEQLLECFLSLNSRRYHGLIVQAFSEVWEFVFSTRAGSRIPVQGRRPEIIS